jgi:hypothetical protein
MKKIPLTQNYSTLVDDEDYEQLIQYRWKAITGKGKIYAARNTYNKGKYFTVYMHRYLMDFPTNTVDHINGDSLDNQRVNLRTASLSQNCANRPSKGYYRHGKRFRAFIGKTLVGSFITEEEAIVAYQKARLEKYGEFAWVKV